jgi:hypothetical protein
MFGVSSLHCYSQAVQRSSMISVAQGIEAALIRRARTRCALSACYDRCTTPFSTASPAWSASIQDSRRMRSVRRGLLQTLGGNPERTLQATAALTARSSRRSMKSRVLAIAEHR